MQSANGIHIVFGKPHPKHLVTVDINALTKISLISFFFSGSQIPGKNSS
jgi:hypothetical protein